MAEVITDVDPNQCLKLADFGPPVGTGDAAPAIQDMIDFGYANGIACFEFGGREYDIDTTVTLPNPQNATEASNVRRATYRGNGAVFNVNSGVTAFQRTYASTSDVDTRYWSPVFRDMTFLDAGDGTGRAIQYWGSSGAIFEALSSNGLGSGSACFEVLFGLYAAFRNCNVSACDGVSFRALSGDGVSAPNLTNGTRSNHNSNLVRFETCRSQMTNASAIGFYVEGVSNYTLQSCVTEGSTCNQCIRVNSNTSLGWKDDCTGRIIDHWLEMTTACATALAIDVRKGLAIIDHLRLGGSLGTALTGRIIDGGVSEQSSFRVSNTAWQEVQADGLTQWFDQGNTATGSDNQWTFEDNVIQAGNTLSDVGKWETVGGVPVNLNELRTFNYNA